MRAAVLLLALIAASAFAQTCSLSGKYTSSTLLPAPFSSTLTGEITFNGNKITLVNGLLSCKATISGTYTVTGAGVFTYSFGSTTPTYSPSATAADCVTLATPQTLFLALPVSQVSISSDCSAYNETVTVPGQGSLDREWSKGAASTTSAAGSLAVFIPLVALLLALLLI